MTVLETIVAEKKKRVELRKRRLPEATLRSLIQTLGPRRSFCEALRAPGCRIIAEVKRASPSAGVLKPGRSTLSFSPTTLAISYERAGAAAVSVLTDIEYFWGSEDALVAVRESIHLPVLRKDFIVDPYQVVESAWLGADAILLIVQGLSLSMLRRCYDCALELGLDVLVEIHADDELGAALELEHAAIGINHRNLHDMSMDMERSTRLKANIPKDRIVVAESGFSTAQELKPMMDKGIHAFLVGSSLASSDAPQIALESMVQGPWE